MEETVIVDSPCYKSAKTHWTIQLMTYCETLEDFDGSRLQIVENFWDTVILACAGEGPEEISEQVFGL